MFNLQKLKNSNAVRALIYISLFYLTFYSMMELLSTDKKPIFKRYDFYCFIFLLSFFMLAVNFYYKRKNKSLTKIKIILFNISLSIVLYFLIFLCIYAIAFSFNFFWRHAPDSRFFAHHSVFVYNRIYLGLRDKSQKDIHLAVICINFIIAVYFELYSPHTFSPFSPHAVCWWGLRRLKRVHRAHNRS